MRKIRKISIIIAISLIVAIGLCGCSNGEIIGVSETELNNMMDSDQSFMLYVGRESCPDCEAFYPEFEKKVESSGKSVYYFDTESKASGKKHMREYVMNLGIEEIPAFLVVENGEVNEVLVGIEQEEIDEIYNRLEE